MIKCENCGKENPEGYDFCDECFKPLIPTSQFNPELDDQGNDYFNLPEDYTFADRYVVKRKIGRTGGLGATYEAQDKKTGAQVSLKLFMRRIISSKKTFTKIEKLFEQLKQYKHPGLANVLDCGIHSRNYFSVFEYIKGEDLGFYLYKRNAPLPTKELYNIFIQLAQVLDFVHSHNLIHGGLNPFNIIYNEKEKKVGITDFGITRVLTGENRTLLRKDGALRMSLFYTPPEILQGEKPTPKSDLYSLGAIMYQLSCNYLPFKSHSSYRLVTYILGEMPIRPSLLNPNLPLYVSEPVMRLLSKTPEERFSFASELIETLKKESRKAKGNLFWLAAIFIESLLLIYILYLLLR